MILKEKFVSRENWIDFLISEQNCRILVIWGKVIQQKQRVNDFQIGHDTKSLQIYITIKVRPFIFFIPFPRQ